MSATASLKDDQVILTFTKPSTNPVNVVRFHHGVKQSSPNVDTADTATVPPGHVLVTFLVSPINPQDMMVIADKYPVKPRHQHQGQSVPGYDGVARVIDVAPPSLDSPTSASTKFRPGDLVIPRVHGLGTWRRWAILACDCLLRLPVTLASLPTASMEEVPSLSPTMKELAVACSMLRTVFLPAYFLIEDMRSLRPGDWVLLNAGNTCIAQLAAQLAVLLKGAKVLRVVRNGNGIKDKNTASIVTVTEQDIRLARWDETTKDAHPGLVKAKKAQEEGHVVLALDAVFGESGERLAGLLSRGGTFVNYGSLGGADGVVHLTQRMLFWNDIRFRSFRLSDQLALRSVAQQECLLGWLVGLLVQGALKAPHVVKINVSKSPEALAGFEDTVKRVLKAASEKEVGARKHVLDFDGQS